MNIFQLLMLLLILFAACRSESNYNQPEQDAQKALNSQEQAAALSAMNLDEADFSTEIIGCGNHYATDLVKLKDRQYLISEKTGSPEAKDNYIVISIDKERLVMPLFSQNGNLRIYRDQNYVVTLDMQVVSKASQEGTTLNLAGIITLQDIAGRKKEYALLGIGGC